MAAQKLDPGQVDEVLFISTDGADTGYPPYPNQSAMRDIQPVGNRPETKPASRVEFRR